MNNIPLLCVALFFMALASCDPKPNEPNEPENPETKVVSVEVDPAMLVLEIGESQLLNADVSPAEADNTTVLWSSDNKGVATVDAISGEVTAIAEGSATITVTTADGGKTATCDVTVNPAPDPDMDVMAEITDPVFRAYCIDRMQNGRTMRSPSKERDIEQPAWDTNRDGKLSPAEASAVMVILLEPPVLGGKVISLKGIEYFRGLTDLICSGNQLLSLDVSKNIALEWLDCDKNLLSSLDISKNRYINYLNCSDNHLTSFEVPSNTSLRELYISRNRISSMKLPEGTTVLTLMCDGNGMTSLDVSGNPELNIVRCEDNEITALDVSGCTTMQWLDCSGNRLTSLDISQCLGLRNFSCTSNPGDGVSEFPVRAWFDNGSVPFPRYFTTGSWNWNGAGGRVQIAVDYQKVI